MHQNDVQLRYAQPHAKVVRAIMFEEDGDSMRVLIPQIATWRAIAEYGIAIAFVVALGVLLAFGIRSTVSAARFGEAVVWCGLMLLLVYVAFSIVQRIIRIARFGHRPMILTFSPETLTIEAPREFGETPRRYNRSELDSFKVSIKRTATFALQVAVLVVTADGARSQLVFFTRQRECANRFCKMARSFLFQSV
jgi:hypothetical protein